MVITNCDNRDIPGGMCRGGGQCTGDCMHEDIDLASEGQLSKCSGNLHVFT